MKVKAQEEEHLPLLNVFIIINHNYKKMILYEVPGNSVRKITTKVYTEKILPAIKNNFLDQGLIL